MKLLNPTKITDPEFLDSSVIENDAAPFDAAGTYALGQRAIWKHRLYESRVAGNVGNFPDAPLSADKWLDLGPTNRWAMFDQAVGTVTKGGLHLGVALKPGYIDALAFLETQAAVAFITLVAGDTLVYSREINFDFAGKRIDNWYDYFFAPVGRSKSMVVEGIPMYADGILSVRLEHETQAQCGVMLVGTMFNLGDTMARAQLSFTDFSRKVTNDFGATSIVERPFAKKANMQVVLPTSAVDETLDKLTEVRAKPVLYIGDGKMDWLRVYGLAKRAEITVEYVDFSYLALELEGLI